jgi:hypothetical protein
VDTARIGRLNRALMGGRHALWADQGELETAAGLERRWPGLGRLFTSAHDFHAAAAARAVREDGARAVGFGASGFPAGTALHAAAAAASPAARFVYFDADPGAVLVSAGLLAGPGVAAVPARLDDPGQITAALTARAEGGPVSLQAQLTTHLGGEEVCRHLIGEYARLLPPGSTLVLSVLLPSRSQAGGELAQALSRAYGTRVYRHGEEDLAAWLTGAGLGLHWEGVTDVRQFGRLWPGTALPSPVPGRVAGAAARVPAARVRRRR